MQFAHTVALLLPAFALAAYEGTPCDQNGKWDCGGDASLGWTMILQCSYNNPGSDALTWRRTATCDHETPCCDQRAVEMNNVPHCNVRPTEGEFTQWCGLPGPN